MYICVCYICRLKLLGFIYVFLHVVVCVHVWKCSDSASGSALYSHSAHAVLKCSQTRFGCRRRGSVTVLEMQNEEHVCNLCIDDWSTGMKRCRPVIWCLHGYFKAVYMGDYNSSARERLRENIQVPISKISKHHAAATVDDLGELTFPGGRNLAYLVQSHCAQHQKNSDQNVKLL